MSAVPDFTRKAVLTGELVTLRPVTADDAPRLARLMEDPEVTRLTGSAHSTAELTAPSPWPLEKLTEIYGRWATADDRIVWAVVENATGEVVGESVLNELDTGNLSCGFRIWLSGVLGRGLGTEATRLTVQHAFDAGLHRVELEVYDFNPRARRVYEKVGFVHEGTRRQALRFDDAWVDCHLMAVLSTDPRP
ncbi:MAG TPA: GNAT family protein [Nocardioidaceae bacterium]|nr:GNAT family protein [Nocardioidaceae bacterium]